MELSTYLSLERTVDIETIEKDELLNLLIDLIAKSDKVTDAAKMKKAVFAREKTMSTGIGKGIAVPHARTDGVTDFVVAVARVRQGLDFGSDDKLPVKLVFMLVASDKQDKQVIKLLSRLVLRLKNEDFVTELLTADSATEIYRIIRETK
jgi:fructose-specific phosphotransferase system IIA component